MSISNFKKFAGLLVFCVVVLVIETIASHPPRQLLEIGLANSSPAHDDAFRFLAKKELLSEHRPSIALMGSSQIREAFDASVIERRIKEHCNLDWQVTNLGVSGGGALDLVFTMDAVRDKSPEIIVAWPTWRKFYLNEVQLNLHYYADSTPRMLELLFLFAQAGELTRHYSSLSPAYLAAILPSSRWARSYRLESLLQTYFLTNSSSITEFAYARAGDPRRVQKRLDSYRNWSKRIKVGQLEDVHQKFFEGAVHRARKTGIEVVVIDVYNSPAYEDIRPLTEVRQDYFKFLEALKQRYKIQHISAEEFPKIEAIEFTDHTHVNARGRDKLSNYLAEYLISTYIAGVYATCK